MALDANILGGVSANRAEVVALNSALRVTQPQRRATGTLAAINAETVLTLDGESSATLWLNGTGTFNATYTVQGSPDGVNFFDLLTYPVPQFCVGGTTPLAGQPLISEAVNAATVQRLLSFACDGLQSIRVRLTAYTSGSSAVNLSADIGQPLSPYVFAQRAATLAVTATAATGVAVTATLPAVVGIRHYLDRVDVTQIATATAAGVTAVTVTTTNLPGLPILSFGSDYTIGQARQQSLDFGASGGAATALNTATTIVCPATTNVIWRVNALYRLGQ
jgi:hypothetical protein